MLAASAAGSVTAFPWTLSPAPGQPEMPGGAQRDPLSVAYDGQVRRVLIQAIRRQRNKQAGLIVWIASPRGQFRQLDRGGRTQHERAFTRSAYYQVFKVPYNAGEVPDYSLRLDWGDERRASSHGRLARPVRVTLFPFGATSHRRRGPSYLPEGTGFRSTLGNRIDS